MQLHQWRDSPIFNSINSVTASRSLLTHIIQSCRSDVAIADYLGVYTPVAENLLK